MISFNEAQDILSQFVALPSQEKIPLTECLGRVLAEDVYSDIPVPPFNTSAMDGYACRFEDIHSPLNLTEVIPAGKLPELKIMPGNCAKIMTGALVPEGATCVIMVEHTRINEQGKIIFTGKSSNSNIRYKGEEINSDALVLKKGTMLHAAHIGFLASMGKSSVHVNKQLQVGIVATGSELVEPQIIPEPGKIRNSNSYQLLAQVKQTGNSANYYGIVADDEISVYEVIKTAISKNDVVIISGGVSMGDYDLVPMVLEKLGTTIQFREIAVKPGKPVLFGTVRNKFIFGMPGNPVSCFVQFEFLLKPFLYRLMGSETQQLERLMPLEGTLKKKKAGIRSFVPVKINDSGKIVAVPYLGSAHLSAISDSDGLAIIPEEIEEYNSGDLVNVRLI